MSADIRVCEADGEPLVFTLDFPGAEYVCVVCGRTDGIIGRRIESTPELVKRQADLAEVYKTERAVRLAIDHHPSPKVGDPGVPIPVCIGCGASPPEGTPLDKGKPPTWLAKGSGADRQVACSRSCIPADSGMVLPW